MQFYTYRNAPFEKVETQNFLSDLHISNNLSCG